MGADKRFRETNEGELEIGVRKIILYLLPQRPFMTIIISAAKAESSAPLRLVSSVGQVDLLVESRTSW